MLDLAILGLLQGQDLHGYEIRRRLRDELGVLTNVSFGSLYPALSRLERSGAVIAVAADEEDRPPVPMTGSLSGERAAFRARRPMAGRGRRARKVYRITDEGRRQFAALLAAEPGVTDDARSFGLRLAFFRHVPPAARLPLLERRRAQLLERLGTARRAAAATGTGTDPYAHALMAHVADSLERDIAWLDGLIGAERAAAGSSPASGSSGPGGPGSTSGPGGTGPADDLAGPPHLTRPALHGQDPSPTAVTVAAAHPKGTTS